MADALLTVENLSKSFGDKLLFEDISFGINADWSGASIGGHGNGIHQFHTWSVGQFDCWFLGASGPYGPEFNIA